MNMKKLFLLGTLAMFCMTGSAQENNKSNDSFRVEETLPEISAKSILQFWPTYTAVEIEKFVFPELYEIVMNETGYEELAKCFTPHNDGIVAVIKREDRSTLNSVVAKANGFLPENVILFWGARPEEDDVFILYAIKDDDSDGIAPLQGDIIEKVKAGFSAYSNAPIINIKMNSEAAAIWSDMTAECAKEHRPIAIVVDGLVYSAPMPAERITGGESVISGNFTIEDVKELVEKLK